jgi:hypothetical protein
MESQLRMNCAGFLGSGYNNELATEVHEWRSCFDDLLGAPFNLPAWTEKELTLLLHGKGKSVQSGSKIAATTLNNRFMNPWHTHPTPP